MLKFVKELLLGSPTTDETSSFSSPNPKKRKLGNADDSDDDVILVSPFDPHKSKKYKSEDTNTADIFTKMNGHETIDSSKLYPSGYANPQMKDASSVSPRSRFQPPASRQQSGSHVTSHDDSQHYPETYSHKPRPDMGTYESHNRSEDNVDRSEASHGDEVPRENGYTEHYFRNEFPRLNLREDGLEDDMVRKLFISPNKYRPSSPPLRSPTHGPVSHRSPTLRSPERGIGGMSSPKSLTSPRASPLQIQQSRIAQSPFIREKYYGTTLDALEFVEESHVEAARLQHQYGISPSATLSHLVVEEQDYNSHAASDPDTTVATHFNQTFAASHDREMASQNSLSFLRTAAAKYISSNVTPDLERLKKARELELRKKQKPVTKTLTEEELAIVGKILKGPEAEVLTVIDGIDLKRYDIRTLSGTEWLNDEVVNAFMFLLTERAKSDPAAPKFRIVGTHWYTLMTEHGYNYSRVRTWTRRFDVFALDKLIVPVSLGTHWTLAVVNFKEKRFEYYDSLGAANQKCIDALRKWIQDESADKKKKPFDISDWTDYSPLEIPHQVNGWDCGVFMCRYADCQTRDVDYDFSQAEMPYFRRRMILEIVQKKLFDV